MEWKPVNSRLIRIRLRGRHNNLSILQCYAPTNDHEEEDKDLFYEQLQAELNEIPRHDVITLIGDLNAKVGDDNNGAERTMGKFGCGSINNNGERLVEFCASNDLVIGGTLFNHPAIHRLTWYSPNGRDKNQIDHIAINGIWRGSLLDVRVKRGADVGSDHLLVIVNIRLKLRRTDQRHADHRRLDVNKLKDPDVKRSFIIQIRNRFQALSDQENNTQQEMEDTNHLWNQVKTTYQEAGRTILGHRNERHKDWISQEAWQKIEERKDIKKKVLSTKSERIKTQQQQAYREADRAIKQIIRHDKRKHLEDMATQAEEAAYKGDQRTLYKITKQVCGKFRSITTAPIKNKEGQLLTSETAQEARWTEHFNEVLNRPAPETEPGIQEAEEDLDVATTPPTKEEIIRAIKSLKNNKAPGPDFLNAELFKSDPPLAAEILLPLLTTAWNKKEIPEDWKEGVIIKIPKKGTLSDCNNWRGITLLSIPSKVLAKIVINHISSAVDGKLREEQAGFRQGRGCIDQIFTLRNIIEQCIEWQRELYINFVDFEKAFDSIHRNSLWKILRYISNEDLLEQCQQETMETIIIRRRWKWIGHVLRKEQDAIPRVVVQWRPEGHRKRGRPKTTWRRTVEAEAAAMGQSWGTLRMLAQDPMHKSNMPSLEVTIMFAQCLVTVSQPQDYVLAQTQAPSISTWNEVDHEVNKLASRHHHTLP
ncbi:hypothetical protein RRG08_064743 [Elysia crispata]|uniref:Reverse transcriptase domain-containing protein n=1 Tax=Elysia crispata TaxID=231223 RepID=A0AAE0YZF2_9GAST|nr:hypothetical protein RRG08_064743 [Elysia crispata]